MDEEIPPLPEGWTPERVSSTDPRTIAALPDEIYLPIRDWNIVMGRRAMAEHQARLDAQNAEINAKRIAAGLKTQDELDLEFTLRMGMPESQLHTTLWDVAKVMDQNGDQAWGFVVVKTWGYGADGPRWSQYWTSLSAKIEGLLRDAGVGPDGDIHSGIAGKFRMVLIEDENALDGANEAAVQDYLGPLLHSDDEDSYDRFPEGVNRDIVLVVTEKASNSLLSPRGKTPPWLMAVLMEGDELEEEEDDDDDGPRVRSWKTSIDWLIELWQSLQRQPPDELEAFEGKIWQGFLDEADDEAEDGV